MINLDYTYEAQKHEGIDKITDFENFIADIKKSTFDENFNKAYEAEHSRQKYFLEKVVNIYKIKFMNGEISEEEYNNKKTAFEKEFDNTVKEIKDTLKKVLIK